MRRFLFYFRRFLFLGIIICDLQNFVFAIEDEDHNASEPLNNSKIHSIVDASLKINKHFDPAKRNLYIQKLKKKRNKKKALHQEDESDSEDEFDSEEESDTENDRSTNQEDARRSKEKAKGRSSSASKRPTHSSSDVSKNKHPTSEVDSSDSGRSASSQKSRSLSTRNKRRVKSKRYPLKGMSDLLNRVYTIKTPMPFPSVTNKFLNNTYKVKFYGKSHPDFQSRTGPSAGYVVKSYGAQPRDDIVGTHSDKIIPTTKQFTIKSERYFRGTKPCSSGTGCS
ncbi:MAG: hypothetical protein LBB25_01620 [Holosporaceae bacterium]|jgi:hypothetical protein|nr:hypothetical protein [Holosporaceae bacterium]